MSNGNVSKETYEEIIQKNVDDFMRRRAERLEKQESSSRGGSNSDK